MVIFIASFIIMLIAVIAMATGILLGRPAISGSCGGLNHVGLSGSCGGACSTEHRKACTLKRQQAAPKDDSC